MSDNWPDWSLKRHDMMGSMHKLARYANPAQVYAMGLGLGLTNLDEAHADGRAVPVQLAQAAELAEALTERRSRYTVEPFHPGEGREQIIRPTQELLDGSGTCVDFAVTMAALCVHENVQVSLAVAMPAAGGGVAHAFVIVHEDGGALYSRDSYQSWAQRLSADGAADRVRAIDVTPSDDQDDPGDLATRTAALLTMLSTQQGRVHVVGVQATLRTPPRGMSSEFYAPPPARRELGITSYLPDKPTHLDTYPSRDAEEAKLDQPGHRIVVVGDPGTGKSTMALKFARDVNAGRGWFLDGSDRVTLLRSLAAAEAASRGSQVGFADAETLGTLSYFARRRLRASERPWVLVVDNANEPAEISDLLIEPGPRDYLIVTTTDIIWADEQERKHWTVIRLDRLDPRELPDDGPATRMLSGAELLPGIVRIARRAAPEALAAVRHDEPGVTRIVRAALGMTAPSASTEEWLASPLRTAVLAASFMPAEQIGLRWLARAVFDGDDAAARAGLLAMEEAGLVERSRNLEGGQPGDAPLWMHRLIRDAVRQLAADVDVSTGVAVLAQYPTGTRYSSDELTGLSTFLGQAAAQAPSAAFVVAATTVLDLLETGGSDAVSQAGTLAGSYVDDIPNHLPLDSRVGLDAWATAQMAIVRVANHKDASEAQLRSGILRSQEVVSQCTVVMDDLPQGGDDHRAALLLRGRANAMEGILRRKQADAVRTQGDSVRAAALLKDVLDVLRASYRERRSVFEVISEAGLATWLPDPDRHVDRGWYNIGGVSVALANALYDVDQGVSGRAEIADVLSEGMAAYAGSLHLRRRSAEITKYAAASLWGVALAAYTAALYCPGELALEKVEPIEELAVVRQDQSRVNLLRVAEDCAAKAVAMWVEIDGVSANDTGKGRSLLRKVMLVWDVTNAEAPGRARQLRSTMAPTMKDLRVKPEHMVATFSPERPSA